MSIFKKLARLSGFGLEDSPPPQEHISAETDSDQAGDQLPANRNEDSNYDNESERYSGGAEAWSEEEDVESPVAELYDDDTTDAKQEVERWSQDDSPQEAEPDLPRQESSHKIYQRQSSQSPQIARATSPTIKVTTQTSLQRADTWSEFEASQELDRAEPAISRTSLQPQQQEIGDDAEEATPEIERSMRQATPIPRSQRSNISPAKSQRSNFSSPASPSWHKDELQASRLALISPPQARIVQQESIASVSIQRSTSSRSPLTETRIRAESSVRRITVPDAPESPSLRFAPSRISPQKELASTSRARSKTPLAYSQQPEIVVEDVQPAPSHISTCQHSSGPSNSRYRPKDVPPYPIGPPGVYQKIATRPYPTWKHPKPLPEKRTRRAMTSSPEEVAPPVVLENEWGENIANRGTNVAPATEVIDVDAIQFDAEEPESILTLEDLLPARSRNRTYPAIEDVELGTKYQVAFNTEWVKRNRSNRGKSGERTSKRPRYR